MGGISLGGILVIIGIVVAILWSLWLGIVIALIGLIAFGGLRGGGGTERHFGWPEPRGRRGAGVGPGTSPGPRKRFPWIPAYSEYSDSRAPSKTI